MTTTPPTPTTLTTPAVTPPAGLAAAAGPAGWAELVAGLQVTPERGPQAQGDVLVLPWPPAAAPAARAAALADGKLIPAAGIPVLAGSGGHAHVVHAATGIGAAYAPTLSPAAMTLGVLAVPPGAAALLAHDEHPDLHIGPGVYALRRQRAAALPTTTPARATTPEPTTVPVWD